jgi:hypothetical protein
MREETLIPLNIEQLNRKALDLGPKSCLTDFKVDSL